MCGERGQDIDYHLVSIPVPPGSNSFTPRTRISEFLGNPLLSSCYQNLIFLAELSLFSCLANI